MSSVLAPASVRCNAAICRQLGLKRKCLSLARNDVNDPQRAFNPYAVQFALSPKTTTRTETAVNGARLRSPKAQPGLERRVRPVPEYSPPDSATWYYAGGWSAPERVTPCQAHSSSASRQTSPLGRSSAPVATPDHLTSTIPRTSQPSAATAVPTCRNPPESYPLTERDVWWRFALHAARIHGRPMIVDFQHHYTPLELCVPAPSRPMRGRQELLRHRARYSDRGRGRRAGLLHADVGAASGRRRALPRTSSTSSTPRSLRPWPILRFASAWPISARRFRRATSKRRACCLQGGVSPSTRPDFTLQTKMRHSR